MYLVNTCTPYEHMPCHATPMPPPCVQVCLYTAILSSVELPSPAPDITKLDNSYCCIHPPKCSYIANSRLYRKRGVSYRGEKRTTCALGWQWQLLV